ncbi:hypothetical protein HMP09_0030 [Sphingomonas sp. HMP9]|uniref:hypothetical protein n=1 Tax=Sphingomonas sp. HMP9 TaxID=1517554 RepID=UPI0015968EF2|nr:hypothetical protein [Sphingomonas sp. HMP9]BCA60796.1 hypothetical protein HMP09_0030 [Sphingomonas sp. HMP9]
MHKQIIVAALCMLPTAIAAQTAPMDPAPMDPAIVVPAHTEMLLRLDEEIASDRARVGQSVAVSVARDVIVDGAVLIPRGSPGVGAVTLRTGKGAFGRSGKLDIELRSVEVGGHSVPVVGRYHVAGDGRTGETIGTIIVGGVVAGAFVTGHNAVFEQGRQFTAFTGEATRIARPAIRMARYVPPAALPLMPFARNAPLASPSYATIAYSPPPAIAGPPAYVADGSFAQRLAAAQPVRGGDPRLGWTISD